MSYTPTNWSTGDTITASAMNKIENGIANAGGIFWITAAFDDLDVFRLDKTYLEIYTAMRNKSLCIISSDNVDGPPIYEAQHYIITDIGYDTNAGIVYVNALGVQFTCSSVNDYPEAAD